MEILRRHEIKIEGANAVVLGRSDIVGKPMALLSCTLTPPHDLPFQNARPAGGPPPRRYRRRRHGKAGYVKRTGSSPARRSSM